ncbi:MAG: ISLre2 family transposase [Candidatus Omnitrophica bacterium]|nr:ISLre2 family transposase [Candidatus Omnitrophota bacterium]
MQSTLTKGSATPETTITIEFKPVKIKIPAEGLTLEALEGMVFDIRQEIGKTAFVNALREYDEVLARSRPRGRFRNICKKTKYLQTRAGDIQYKRTLYRERITGKPRYLLDEALKIEKNQRMSLKMAQLMGALSSASPYRAAQEQLSKLLGLSWSHEAIRQNVIREGKPIEEREKKEHQKIKALDYKMPEEVPEVVYNEADAAYIRKQNKNKKRGRKKRHLEVKAGIGYTGKEPRYDKGKRKAKKLSQKIVYADIRAKRDEFLDRFSCISEREFGLSAVKESYLGGDGDSWIREGKKEYFHRSKYLLCPFHLFRNLRKTLPGKKQSQKKLKELFEKNKIDKALSRIKRLTKGIRNRKLKSKLIEFYGYISNNRQGIEASMQVRMDKKVESAGAVEPNIDKVIAHRFKGRGMSWSEDGAQALLKIRQTIINGQWDNWWYKERNKKIEIKAIFKEPITATQMCKKRNITPYIEAELPCYEGPDQSKPWVGVLHELTRARQLS